MTNLDSLRIEYRALTSIEIAKLIEEIKLTINITGYTKSELIKFDNVFVAYHKNDFAGVCINTEIDEKWIELAVLIVFPEFQKNGIGSSLFRLGAKQILDSHKSIYTTSRNPLVIKMMQNYNFKFCDFTQLPINLLWFNLRFIGNWFRITEFFRKRMYDRKYPSFIYGIRYNTNQPLDPR